MQEKLEKRCRRPKPERCIICSIIMIIFFLSAALQTTNPNLFFFFKVGIFLVFLLANAAKIKSQQVQGDENSGGAETGHNLQPYLGKIILKKSFCYLVILSLLISSSDSFTNLETTN